MSIRKFKERLSELEERQKRANDVINGEIYRMKEELYKRGDNKNS